MESITKASIIKKVLSVMLSTFLVLGLFFSNMPMLVGIDTGEFGVQEAYAKDVGDKNEQTCDHCKMVVNGDAPTDSSGNSYEPLANGAVYRGGNAHSVVSENKTDYELDTDPNDFANPLPYGNVYVDATKLTWSDSNKNNFIIDIKDNRFKWVAVDGQQFEDANGFTTTNDPLESGFELKGRTPNNGGGLDEGAISGGFIAYVGELKPYHSDIKAKADNDGFTNTIKAADGDYLYRIIYRDAATLADGTRGNVIMTMTQVDIETSMSVSASNPRVLKDKNGNQYTYTKAVMPIQGANTLRVASGVVDSEGNWVNEPYTVVLTSNEVQTAVNAANANLPSGDKIGAGMVKDKTIRHTAGAAYTFDIQVVDSEGNPAVGTMAYAAKDLDLPSYQNIWGRESADPFMYSEGLSIITGSQSYALVPEYNHSNATTLTSGWVAKGLTDSWDSPLDIQGGSGSNADGVSFRANGEKVLRDQNGFWKDSFFSWNENNSDELMAQPDGSIRDFMWNNINSARLRDKANLSTTPLNDNVKKQLAGKVKDGSGNPKAWDQITAADAVAYIKDGSYAVERNDGNESYDTAFAVLINPKKTTFRWTGSSYNSGQAVTTLFDSTLFTYIEQTHGTGGGIYFETYDIANNCKVNRSEGTVTMGRGTDATVTVVPEDGYRIDTIKIGAKALGSPSTFTPIYDDSGAVTKIKDSAGTEHGLTDDKVTITDTTYGDITFEANDGGSIDVTLPNMQDARHIHADFTADYYFYKVWKSKTQAPTSLKLTATPYAYKFKEVTIDGTKYTISGNTFTNTDSGKAYTLENNALRIGDDPDDVTVYYLEGNDLVSYTYDNPEDPSTRRPDKRFTIRLEYEKNGDPVKFEVIKADAENADETNVIAERDADDYPVWKIRYPAAGYTTKGGKTWPALPIETQASAHNINHVERNYWFVTEDAPGWALVEYDNSKAEAPGVIDVAKDRNEIYKVGTGEDDEDTTTSNYSAWALASTKDIQNAGAVIKHASSSNHAYMSVFSNHDNAITKHNDTWGGKIVNIPLVVVNAEKTWEDFSNAFDTRQDVWFHIDATIDGTKTKDVLPPQKLSATESGDVHTKTWGDKNAYGDDYLSEYAETGLDYSKVKVVGTTSDLPQDIYYAQDSDNPNKFIPMVEDGYEEIGGVQVPNYNPNTEGDIYYVNELTGVDSDGNTITYSLRETDAEGNELDKTDTSKYLIGYETEVSGVAKDSEQATLDEVKVDSYTGKVKNTLETVDFEVTKIWKENGAKRTHSLESDVTKLKAAFTLNENDEKISDTDALKLQPSTAATYVPASGSTPASGTLETKNGEDETEVIFIWHNIPKYIGEDDGEGNITVRKAVYSVVETPLSGYNAPEYSDDTKALNEGTITNEVTPPEGSDRETYGPKNAPQSTEGKTMFEVTTQTALDGSPNKIETVELLDAEGNPATSVTVPEGTYTVDENGKITFTPNDGFVGDPTPVKVRGTDSNGLSADAEYQPHIIDNEKTVTRTITYEYSNGDPVLDSEGNPKTVVHTTTFTGTVDPNTGEVTYPGDPTEEFPEVGSDPIEGYTPDKDKVDKKTVTPSDSDWAERVIYSPKGVTATPDETYGLPGKEQTGTVSFTMETETYTDGTPNELTVKLIDPATGEETDEKTVSIPGQGTYTLNDDGTITFTPEDGYVGNPDPIEVTGTDRFGTKAKTTYTPHVVDPTSQDTAKRTIHFTYLTEDGDEVTEDVVQELTLTRHASSVDPETGEVLEWGPWEPETFPAVDNPDDKVDGKVWETDDVADALDVTEPGDYGVVNIVYTKVPYTVTYLNGGHGKSDGKGDQEGEDYDNDVTGGNTVTPDKGYEFTGTYTYVIKDKDGNIIDSGTTDDPTSLKVTGNIEFTPVYEKLPVYNINYDKNGGTGNMDDNNYSSDEETMPYDENSFARRGYHFTGFHAYITNPETGEETLITDESGNPIVFTGSEDMSEYFKDMPDGTSIRMEAQWVPNAYRLNYDANGGIGTMDSQDFLGSDTSAVSKGNTFTRTGYTFKGFTAILPDGSTIKDANGNDMLFTSVEDFMEYFLDYGDGSEITLVAQWEKASDPAPTPKPDPTPDAKKEAAKTGDSTSATLWLIILAAAVSAQVGLAKARRRKGL